MLTIKAIRRRLRPLRRLARRVSGKSRRPIQRNDLIDVYLTTYRRPDFLKRSMQSLIEACDRSPFRHRITVMVDALDRPTLEVLDPYLERIFLITTPFQLGLPFMYNLMLDHSDSLIARTEESPRLICYLQDDSLITSPEHYFTTLVSVHDDLLPAAEIGYVSGFYTPLHPGFELTRLNGISVLKSDSVDGKNFLGTPERLRSVGRLTWYTADGVPRGNPGPERGSQFDTWQWGESPTSLMQQRRVSLIVPGLVVSMAQSAEESTWDNPGDEPAEIDKRIQQGEVFATRDGNPTVEASDFFKLSI